MTFSLFLAAVVSLPCENLAILKDRKDCSNARQNFVCWTRESEHISPKDPALLLFWERDESERIEDAMIDLAIERINGCDPTIPEKDEQ